MIVKDIVDNFHLFKGCTEVTLETDDYPFYIHSDELQFDKHLNDEIKEIRTCVDSQSGPGTVYLKI